MEKKEIIFIIRAFVFSTIALSCIGCFNGSKTSFTKEECNIIDAADSLGVMKVYTVNDSLDYIILRKACVDFNEKDLDSEMYKKLSDQMLKTVQSPQQNGVGIAGPQVGISRRIIAVQRLDCPNWPFIVYPNIKIVSYFGDKVVRGEGCLSVPGFGGKVERSDSIIIQYDRLNQGKIEQVEEKVGGFTARIFQHECDHLDGIIYTDKATDIRER